MSTDTPGGEAPTQAADDKGMQILFSNRRARIVMDATGLVFAFSLIAVVSQNA